MGTAVQMNRGCGYEEGGADVGITVCRYVLHAEDLALVGYLACCVKMDVSGTECGACSR
jgi:hypothetical protein